MDAEGEVYFLEITKGFDGCEIEERGWKSGGITRYGLVELR